MFLEIYKNNFSKHAWGVLYFTNFLEYLVTIMYVPQLMMRILYKLFLPTDGFAGFWSFFLK